MKWSGGGKGRVKIETEKEKQQTLLSENVIWKPMTIEAS